MPTEGVMTSGFGKRVQQLRRQRSMSVEVLAKLAGVSPKQVHAVEQGSTRNPGIETLARVARALGISADWLLTGESDPDEVVRLYRDLAPPDQHALLRIGRALAESRSEYPSLQGAGAEGQHDAGHAEASPLTLQQVHEALVSVDPVELQRLIDEAKAKQQQVREQAEDMRHSVENSRRTGKKDAPHTPPQLLFSEEQRQEQIRQGNWAAEPIDPVLEEDD